MADFNFADAVENLDGVPEEYRIAYAQGQDGKFAVKDEMKPIWNSLKSNVTNLGNVRKDLQRANGESAQRRQVIKAFEDLLTEKGISVVEGKQLTETLGEHLDQLAASAKNGAELKINFDTIKRDFEKQKNAIKDEADVRVTKMSKTLQRHLIDKEAAAALAKSKGSVELMTPIIKNRVKVVEEGDDYVVRVIDADGASIRFDPKTGGPMTIDGLVAELKGSPEYARAFESETKGGSGTPPAKPAPQAVRQQAGEKTSTQKIAAGLAKQGDQRRTH